MKRGTLAATKSGVGWFVGIVNRNIEYLVATTDGIISCSIVRRLPDNEAYDKKCIDEIDVRYTDYVNIGSRTAPIAVRFAPTSNEVAPDPNRIPTTFVPRAAYLKPKDFMTHGYTGAAAQEASIFIYVFVCVYIYIYIYREREIERER